MKMISVSYDLMRPGQDYSQLWARLRALGGVPVLLSQWTFQSTASAAAIRDDLLGYIDVNDRLLVIDVTTGQFAWHNLKADIKVSLSLT